MIFFKTKDNTTRPDSISMEIAPYYYYTKKSCYLRQDAYGNEIKPFLQFSKNGWIKIKNNDSRFAPPMEDYSYTNYYYQIAKVSNGNFTDK
jgi:hypothetical protein